MNTIRSVNQDLQNALFMFGHTDFKPGQSDIIHAVLAGYDILSVMPTGAGKSLTYQLPAVLGTGLTLVVSPLIALMKDQVEFLTGRGIPVAMLNSSQSNQQQKVILNNLKNLKLLYLAPERFKTIIEQLKCVQIERLVIDEAHCVSSWGHDFRPDYLELGSIRKILRSPPITALTATATLKVQTDIARLLELKNEWCITTGFDRPNLTYRVLHVPGETARKLTLRDLLEQSQKPGLVYVSTQHEAQELAALIHSWNLQVEHYHGARQIADRERVQNAFMTGDLDVVVATNAFGMGIDKSNVRFVIHYKLPGTIEAFYQEAGRAGRDGNPAICTLLFTPTDRVLQEFLISYSIPTALELRRVWAYLHATRSNSKDVDAGQVRVRFLDLERNLEINATKIKTALTSLTKSGGIFKLKSATDTLHARISDKPPSFDSSMFDERRTKRIALLEKMIGFAINKQCRRRALLEYFGEVALWDRCHGCDVCQPKQQLELWERILLTAVQQNTGQSSTALIKYLSSSWTTSEVLTGLKILEEHHCIVNAIHKPRLSSIGRTKLLPQNS